MVERISFDRDRLQRLQVWFTEKGVEQTCPICGGEKFTVEGIFSASEVLSRPKGLTDTGQAIAMVATACSYCTYIMFFDAKRMGLLD
jgi:predicted nucleic-acid-binding Zn-ribbon protein